VNWEPAQNFAHWLAVLNTTIKIEYFLSNQASKGYPGFTSSERVFSNHNLFPGYKPESESSVISHKKYFFIYFVTFEA
jgi:hypothetical protein